MRWTALRRLRGTAAAADSSMRGRSQSVRRMHRLQCGRVSAVRTTADHRPFAGAGAARRPRDVRVRQRAFGLYGAPAGVAAARPPATLRVPDGRLFHGARVGRL